MPRAPRRQNAFSQDGDHKPLFTGARSTDVGCCNATDAFLTPG